MITVLQRVQHAKVEIDGKSVGATEQGLLILLGVAEGDTSSRGRQAGKKKLPTCGSLKMKTAR